jgi:hypothetical protein
MGRVAARQPLYGPLNTVVPPQKAVAWLDSLLHRAGADAIAHLAVMQIARKTGDRYRDLPDAKRDEAADWLESQHAANHLVELVRAGGALDREEQNRVFGEALPKGLRLTQ